MTLRILMAEDSAIFAQALGQLIEREPDMDLLAVAADGQQAVALCQQLRPDLVVMDIQMPKLDGLSATEQIMATCPTPILVVTSDPYRGGVDQSFRALSAGALDLIAKPDMASALDALAQREFLAKIRLLADIPVIRHVRGRTRHVEPRAIEPRAIEPKHVEPKHVERATPRASLGVELSAELVLGVVASTGGPKVLAKLFEELDPTLPLGALIVQHITPGFSAHLARWLDNHSAWRIEEARQGSPLLAGVAYLAPAGVHMTLGGDQTVQLREGPPQEGHCPSGDHLLQSLAQQLPQRALGLILSGMGRDGAQGLLSLRRAGGATLAQDERSCVVHGMPRAALELGAVEAILEPEDMALALAQWAKRLTTSRERTR